MLEPLSEKQKLLVVGLGVLGYLYIFGILALLGWVGYELIHVMMTRHGSAALMKVLFVDAVLVYLILKSLWVRIPKPQGYRINAHDAPELFDLISQIQQKLQTPKVHEVLITEEMNAAIVQYAQWGILGGYKNYLILGLPLMQSLTVKQFAGDLTHELGHIAGAHGKSGIWVYRIRTIWYQLAEHLSGQGWLAELLFRKFFEWYVPYFADVSMQLSRQHEFQADQAAAEFVGAREYAQGFMLMTIKDRLIFDSYWAEIYRQVKDHPLPPGNVYAPLFEKLQASVQISDHLIYLQEDLRMRTQKYDTHPALRERMEFIGCQIQDGKIIDPQGQSLDVNSQGESFAQHYFTPALLMRMSQELSERWQAAIKEEWQRKHQEILELHEQIKRFEANPDQSRSMEAVTAYVQAMGTYGSDREYEEALQKLVALKPNHAGANYQLGLLRLKASDVSGVDHIQRAIAADPTLGMDGYSAIQYFYERQGNYQEADQYRDKIAAQDKMSEAIYKEQNSVTEKDEFFVPLDPELRGFRDQFEPYRKDIKAVYLVQKKTQLSGNTKVIVVFIQFYVSWYRVVSSSHAQILLDKIVPNLKSPPGGQFYLLYYGSDKPVMRKVRKLQGALIYHR